MSQYLVERGNIRHFDILNNKPVLTSCPSRSKLLRCEVCNTVCHKLTVWRNGGPAERSIGPSWLEWRRWCNIAGSNWWLEKQIQWFEKHRLWKTALSHQQVLWRIKKIFMSQSFLTIDTDIIILYKTGMCNCSLKHNCLMWQSLVAQVHVSKKKKSVPKLCIQWATHKIHDSLWSLKPWEQNFC